MKKIIVIFIFLSVRLISQIENQECLIKNSKILTKPTGAAIDIGSNLTALDGYNTGSFNFGIMTDIYKNGLAGFSFNSYSNKNSHYTSPVEVVNPKFNFCSFTLDNEHVFFKNKPINLSIFNKVGIAYGSYNDNYYQQYYYTGRSGAYRPRKIADQYYFIEEPGASVDINLLKSVSLCLGSSYRFVAGGNRFGDATNFNGLNLNMKLRFKITDHGK